MCGCVRLFLTVSLGQVLVELLPVAVMENVVHTGADELLLFVLQVLRHVVRHKHDAALPVHHKEETIKCLRGSTAAQSHHWLVCQSHPE